MDSLTKTLFEMPQTFSSRDFTLKLSENGFSRKLMDQGLHRSFLMKNCESISKKIWKKRSIEAKADEDIQSHIDALKAKGYRILKPSTEWQEL